MKTAVIILGHGSKSSGSDEAIRRIASDVKKSGDYTVVEPAFLQYTKPAPRDALEICIKQKPERIVIVPFFMQSGAHVMRDIPELVETAKRQHPEIHIIVTDYVGTHPLMAKIVLDLIGKTTQDREDQA